MNNQGKKYDLIATEFNNIRAKNFQEKSYLERLTRELPEQAQILDIGCGMGEPIASYLIQRNFKLTGVDASIELLKLAKDKCPAMHCIYADMRTVVIANKYDAIIAWDSFFHLSKPEQKSMLVRFASWLNKKGILLFTSGDQNSEVLHTEMLGEKFSYYSLAPETYKTYLKTLGFEVLLTECDQAEHRIWLARLLN